MTKCDLRNGMFGVCNDDNDVFVIVNGNLIYQNGLTDRLDDINDNLEFPDGCKIMKLYEASCFEEVKDGNCNLIWERNETEEKAVEDGTIKITEEQFFEAVKKANEKFMEIGRDTPGATVLEPLLGIQNILFGELIGAVLFHEEQLNEVVSK